MKEWEQSMKPLTTEKQQLPEKKDQARRERRSSKREGRRMEGVRGRNKVKFLGWRSL